MTHHDEQDEKFYDESKHGYFRDLTQMDEADRAEWRDEDIDGYEQNLARQIHSESKQSLSTDHPIDPHSDQRVRDLEEDRHAHGGSLSIIAARMKEREARDPDPGAAGDCRRTIEEDIKLQASRLRKKHNLE